MHIQCITTIGYNMDFQWMFLKATNCHTNKTIQMCALPGKTYICLNLCIYTIQYKNMLRRDYSGYK